MSKKTNITYPKKLIICGIPFQLDELPFTGEKTRTVSERDYVKQTISISQDLPFPRWLSYLAGEIAELLLVTSGVNSKSSDSVACHVGPVLYRFFRENKFDWIYTDEIGEPPTTLFVNGLPYVLMTDADTDTYLDARDLMGEVDCAMLNIRLHSSLKAEPKAIVYLHEATHAILYEARCMGIWGKESLVEPLSNLLYQLFKQNDFSFAYNGE